eukprot:2814176-Amphidinium_carterae.3
MILRTVKWNGEWISTVLIHVRKVLGRHSIGNSHGIIRCIVSISFSIRLGGRGIGLAAVLATSAAPDS